MPREIIEVNAEARCSAIAKSPVNAPERMESARRAISSPVGVSSIPVIAEALVVSGSPICQYSAYDSRCVLRTYAINIVYTTFQVVTLLQSYSTNLR